MVVYLIEESSYELAKLIASKDDNAHLVLLEDAVYLAASPKQIGEVYAISEDVERRGLKSKLKSSTHLINYDQLVELIEKEKVVNLL